MIDAITGVNSDTANAPSIADSIDGGQDLFLQLLVAQVRYQNPLEPMDNNEYLAQTAQFTMVEQMTKVAEQQSELLAFQRATLASGLVGQTVTGIDEMLGSEISGVVESVEYNYGDPQLVIGGQRVGLDEIVSTGVGVDDPADTGAESTDDETAVTTEEVGL